MNPLAPRIRQGVVVKDCLSKVSSAVAHLVEQRKVGEARGMGCIFVWVFYFGQAK